MKKWQKQKTKRSVVQCEPQATASTQAAKPQRAIEDLFDENEDVGKKASNYGVESSASKD
ncbi:unnamed protein product [Brassica napus]|uniref:(rape) hypothetical protein n=1 Tax=Brassica napus TaxID=3708 RepID=A0A816YEL3_BRANA|nr:unnamed protein product [Brassica napus]